MRVMNLSTALIFFLGLMLIAAGIILSVESAHERAAYIVGCVEAKQQAMKSDSRMVGVLERECEQNWKNYKERN